MRIISVVTLLCLLTTGCAQLGGSQVSLQGTLNPKNTITGTMSNGSISYSEGYGCTPATPNPLTPIPVPTPVVSMVPQNVCGIDGKCTTMLVPKADSTPACYTQLAVVRGTDTTTYFGWLLAGLAAAAVAVSTGT